MHESRKGRQVANCRLFLDDGTPFGVSHARQIIQSLLAHGSRSGARQKKKEIKSVRAECKWEDKTGQETQDHCASRRSGYE